MRVVAPLEEGLEERFRGAPEPRALLYHGGVLAGVDEVVEGLWRVVAQSTLALLKFRRVGLAHGGRVAQRIRALLMLAERPAVEAFRSESGSVQGRVPVRRGEGSDAT